MPQESRLKKRMLVRKLHYWVTPIIALPFLVVIISGLFLQVKKEISWIQPPTAQVTQIQDPKVSWVQILDSLKAHPELHVESWKDIKKLDVRPSKGLAKIHLKPDVEVQVNLQDGQILQIAQRRSDLIESLHDGSWFADWAKLGLFLPSGILVLFLWLSGVILFFLPIYLKRRRLKNLPK